MYLEDAAKLGPNKPSFPEPNRSRFFASSSYDSEDRKASKSDIVHVVQYVFTTVHVVQYGFSRAATGDCEGTCRPAVPAIGWGCIQYTWA